MVIAKIIVDTKDTAANVVTMRFEEETVEESIIKIAAKLKLHLSKEDILSRYALVLQGVTGAKYFPMDHLVTEFITPEVTAVCFMFILSDFSYYYVT